MDRVLKDYRSTFKTPHGERVLKHLEIMFGVRDTIEPEEMLNKHLEASGEHTRCPIDSHAMAKRLGLRSAYWKIQALLERAEESLG